MTVWQKATGVLAALLVAALVAVVVLVASGGDDRAQQLRDAESGADAAARAAAVSLTSYGFKTLDTDFTWAQVAGTAKLQAYYAEVTPPIREFVEKSRTTAVGTVVDSAAHATDVDHVTVLLFVDQTLTSPTSTERALDQPRMTMLMVRQGDRWLLDEVKLSNLTTS